MVTPHTPGVFSGRQWDRSSYDDYQWALWTALEDAYYADVSGYGHCRMPAPGEAVDMERFSQWQHLVTVQWEFESSSRGGGTTRGLTPSDWPPDLWLYLYQWMLAAEPLKGKRPVYD